MVGNEGDMNLVETMTSIAKCGSTLELHVPPEGFSAIPFLRKSLKLYSRLSSGGDMDVDMDAGQVDLDPEARKKCIENHFADIPVSRAQCERAWVELCGFVFRDTDTDYVACWRPSPKAKLDVWKRMVDGAVLQGIDMEKQFLARDLWRSLLEEGSEEPFPQPLFEAVLRRICEPEDGQDQVSAASNLKCESPGALFISTCSYTNLGASLDKASCTRWVGETYLEAMAPAPGSAIGRSEFFNAWRDHLPESWRNEVSLSKLNVSGLVYRFLLPIFPQPMLLAQLSCAMLTEPRRRCTSILTLLQYVSWMILNGRKRRRTFRRNLVSLPKRQGTGTSCSKVKSDVD